MRRIKRMCRIKWGSGSFGSSTFRHSIFTGRGLLRLWVGVWKQEVQGQARGICLSGMLQLTRMVCFVFVRIVYVKTHLRLQKDTALSLTQLKYTPKNRLLDLTSTAEDHSLVWPRIFYIQNKNKNTHAHKAIQTGNELDYTMRPGRSGKESLSLIRKFNRHSELVLKGA